MNRKNKNLLNIIYGVISENNGLMPKEILLILEQDYNYKIQRQVLTRYISDLTKSNHIIAEGSGPSRTYFKLDLDKYFSSSSNLRKSAYYNFSHQLPEFSSNEVKKLHPKIKNYTFDRAMHEKFLIELSWASSNLEGNTYSLLETEALVKYGQVAQGKQLEETQMILNHKEAVDFLLTNYETMDFNSRTVLEIHALVSNGLLSNSADSGRIRQHMVSIGGSSYKPLENEFQIKEELEKLVGQVNAEKDPYNQSIQILVGLSYLQPFADCNKRTGRLLANLPLIKANLPPISFTTIDKYQYILGLVSYYELNHTQTIKNAYIEGYVKSYDYYHNNALVVKPELSGILFKHRKLIKGAVKKIINENVEFNDRFFDKEVSVNIEEDREKDAVKRAIKKELKNINPAKGVLFGLQYEQVEKYLSIDSKSNQSNSNKRKP